MFERVLIVAAHCDDAELGCGGYMLRNQRGQERRAIVLVGNYDPKRRKVSDQLMAALKVQATYLDEPDCAVEIRRETVATIEQAIEEFQPEAVFTHSVEDTHQDHRMARLMVATALRRKAISLVEMDGPSTTLDWRPNWWCSVNGELKTRLLEPYVPLLGQDLVKWASTPDSAAALRGIQACERFRIVQYWGTDGEWSWKRNRG